MRLPDEVLRVFWRLVTDAEPDELVEIDHALEDGATNPMSIKKRLGERLVTMYYDAGAATHARTDFEAQFSRHEVPEHLERRRRPRSHRSFVGRPDAAGSDRARRAQRSGAIDGIVVES